MYREKIVEGEIKRNVIIHTTRKKGTKEKRKLTRMGERKTIQPLAGIVHMYTQIYFKHLLAHLGLRQSACDSITKRDTASLGRYRCWMWSQVQSTESLSMYQCQDVLFLESVCFVSSWPINVVVEDKVEIRFVPQALAR